MAMPASNTSVCKRHSMDQMCTANIDDFSWADALPEVMILVDVTGVIQAANRSARSKLGMTAARLGDDLAHLLDNPPDQLLRHMSYWRRCTRPVPTPLRWRRDLNVTGRWRCQALPMSRNAKGVKQVLLRWLPSSGSMSEIESLAADLLRKRAEQRQLKFSQDALQLEHERAMVTLHSIGDGVITTDADGMVQYLNPVAERLCGWLNKEARGKPFVTVFDIVHEQTRKRAVNPIARCLKRGDVVELANHTVLIARNGAEYVIEDSAAPIRDEQGRVLGAVLVFRDVTEEQLAHRQLRYLAEHDPLTGLYNRHFFEQELERAVQLSRRGASSGAIMYMDLNRFKQVNDTAGHSVGDELLRELATLFSQRIRETDVLARLGGDEFGVLFDNVDADQALELARGYAADVENLSFRRKGVRYDVTASIGVAVFGRQVSSKAEALRRADIACYAAKRQGRTSCRMYLEHHDERDLGLDDLKMIHAIKDGLLHDHLELVFQPIMHTQTGDIAHYEVLLRFPHEDGSLMLPAPFINTAERNGLMIEIDQWVLLRAVALLEDMHKHGRGTRFSINLSGTSLGDRDMLKFIRDRVAASPLPPGSIMLEITESVALAVPHMGYASAFMRELQDIGCRFALDDFGTGFSSFTYLKHLPVDYVKIDGAFVRDIQVDPFDQAMVRSINQVAHSMGIETIAEYVADRRILQRLAELGVDYAQGNFMGEPRTGLH